MKKLLILLTILLLLPLAAQATVYEIADESGLPAEWAERDLLRLTMLDTDRSDAMLLECGGEAMMIDGGSWQFRDRLDDMLSRRGITELKYLYATHSDNDHIHGFVHVMSSDAYQVGALLNPNPENYQIKGNYHEFAVNAAKRNDIPYVIIAEGDQFTLGNATIDVLRCNELWGQNARSASAMVRFGNARFLTTGDIDNRTMSWYADRYDPAQLTCDILKVPHHGLAAIPDDFYVATLPEMLLVPNNYKELYENKRSFVNWTQNTFKGSLCKYSGDGAVVCVTDGQDWYIWQEPNWKKTN